MIDEGWGDPWSGEIKSQLQVVLFGGGADESMSALLWHIFHVQIYRQAYMVILLAWAITPITSSHHNLPVFTQV